MDCNSNITQENLRRIWDTFNTPLRKTPGARACNSIKDVLEIDGMTPIEENFIGLQSVKGIDIYRQENAANGENFKVHSVDFREYPEGGGDVDQWLGRSLAETYGLDSATGLRILLGSQVLPGDRLRPTRENCPVRFERQTLLDAFHFPAVLLDKVGRRQRWCFKFPNSEHAADRGYTFGINTGFITALWNRCGSVSYCFIVDYKVDHGRERLQWVVENLKDLATSGLFVPFLLADTEITSLGVYLDERLEHDVWGLEQVGRYLGLETIEATNKAFDIVSELALHARVSAAVTAAFRVLIDMKTIVVDPIDASSAGSTSTGDEPSPTVEQELKQILELRIQEMHNVMTTMDYQVESTQRELQDRLTVAGHNITARLAEAQTVLTKDGQLQQTQAIKLAEATHMIGEATLRDSSAMKALALVATVYLPPTTVATILSMPFFDWSSARAASITNDRIWVYFAAMLPLLVVTVSLWWSWMHWEDLIKAWRRRKSGKNSVDSA